jgi:hypothetical protein
MRMNLLTATGAALLLCAVASVFVLRSCSKTDVVRAHFPDDKAMTDSALGWIGFERGELSGARDIYLHTDLDSNAFMVSLKFARKAELARFEKMLLQKASDSRKIPCGTPNPQCSTFAPPPKGVVHLEIKRQVGVFDSVHWVLNPETFMAIGSTSLPPPSYLSRTPGPEASPR